jgi:hypothetical protein
MRLSCYDRTKPGGRAFLVKQHDYGGGVLTDGAVIMTEGAPLPGHVLSSGNGRWGAPLTPPVTSDRRGEERRRPRTAHRKDPERCTELGETSGHPRVPLGGSRSPTVQAHNAGPRLAGGRHLQPRAMHKPRKRPQGIPRSLKEDPRQQQSRLTA